MRRITAICLLLFALAGTCVPVALAAQAAPQHACCIRHAHHCHESGASTDDQLAIRDIACCNHDCCRAVTTSHRAHPLPRLTVAFALQTEVHAATPVTAALARPSSNSPSPRAPPLTALS